MLSYYHIDIQVYLVNYSQDFMCIPFILILIERDLIVKIQQDFTYSVVCLTKISPLPFSSSLIITTTLIYFRFFR